MGERIKVRIKVKLHSSTYFKGPLEKSDAFGRAVGRGKDTVDFDGKKSENI